MSKINIKGLILFLAKTLLVLYVFVSAAFMFNLWARISKLEDKVIPKPKFSQSDLTKLAKQIGLNDKDFKKCLDSGATVSNVEADFNGGRAAGIQGTPGSLLVDLSTNKAVRIDGGALPLEVMKSLINDYMSGKSLDVINAPYVGTDGKGEKIMTALDTYTPISDGDAVLGASNAKFAIIEYSDFECPFCARFHPTMQSLLSEYKGDMMWVYRHFPLVRVNAGMHPNSEKYAEAAECAKVQGGNDAFWQMGNAMFTAQQ